MNALWSSQTAKQLIKISANKIKCEILNGAAQSKVFYFRVSIDENRFVFRVSVLVLALAFRSERGGLSRGLCCLVISLEKKLCSTLSLNVGHNPTMN